MSQKNIASQWIEIDLCQIAKNLRVMQALVGDIKIMICVKADAYGHGALQVAHTIRENGAYGVCVACVEEALWLRRARLDGPILVLGRVYPEQMREAIQHDLIVTVESEEEVTQLSQIATSSGRSVEVHVKIDTGMGRRGIMYTEPETLVDLMKKIRELPGVIASGCYTHFSQSDGPDSHYTKIQLQRFLELVERLQVLGLCPPLLHASNSATTLLFPEARFDMIRIGMVVYGYRSSDSMPALPEGVRPALRFKTRLGGIKLVPKGTPIGYSSHNQVERDTWVSTIDVGFSHCFGNGPSRWKAVMIHGVKIPVLEVCMNSSIVDVTDYAGPELHPGDEVTLPEEHLMLFSPLIKRVYKKACTQFA
ncbi:MAG TPA: alanine racemase [Ktedonosporobacter sp.]|jgi:alanine racemase|nr:alanine racemase [Ktedonosporobacter sp.]